MASGPSSAMPRELATTVHLPRFVTQPGAHPSRDVKHLVLDFAPGWASDPCPL